MAVSNIAAMKSKGKYMLQWLYAKFYDKLIEEAEEKGLREWRKNLLQDISGDVLEIGSGTGANLEFYSGNISRLILNEPSSYMIQKLREKLAALNNSHAEISNDTAESLSLKNESVDVVVSTLVLCSVNHLEKSLSEIHRVLKPQGKLIFIEHVLASNNFARLKWQHRLEFLWKHIACGCHLTRDTENAIKKAGFN